MLTSGAFVFTLALRSPGCAPSVGRSQWYVAVACGSGTLVSFPLLSALAIGQHERFGTRRVCLMMTGRSLVPAGDVSGRRVTSPVYSMIRESSVTLLSGASRIPFARSS